MLCYKHKKQYTVHKALSPTYMVLCYYNHACETIYCFLGLYFSIYLYIHFRSLTQTDGACSCNNWSCAKYFFTHNWNQTISDHSIRDWPILLGSEDAAVSSGVRTRWPDQRRIPKSRMYHPFWNSRTWPQRQWFSYEKKTPKMGREVFVKHLMGKLSDQATNYPIPRSRHICLFWPQQQSKILRWTKRRWKTRKWLNNQKRVALINQCSKRGETGIYLSDDKGFGGTMLWAPQSRSYANYCRLQVKAISNTETW